MFKFILKQQNYKNSEYTDLTKYDNNNVHQNSITNIAQNFLLKLCNENNYFRAYYLLSILEMRHKRMELFYMINNI